MGLGTEVEAAPIFAKIDSNKDGKIDYAEFLAYLHSNDVSDHHAEAVERIIDQHLEKGCGQLLEGSPISPVKLRKRDQIAKQVGACFGFGNEVTDLVSPNCGPAKS